jgi:hypothetical protein
MIDPETRAAMVEAAAKALFDDSMGGTSDPTLIDMLASICERQAELAINAFMKAAEARGFKLVARDTMRDWGNEVAFQEWCDMHDAAPGWGIKE